MNWEAGIVFDDFGDASDGGSDGGCANAHGFEDGEGDAFEAGGEDGEARGGGEAERVVSATDEFDGVAESVVGFGLGLELVHHGAVASNDEDGGEVLVEELFGD